MKLDIEGGEYDALLGASNMLSDKAVKRIFFELVEWSANRNGHSTIDIKRLLLDAGYSIYEVRKGRLKPLARSGTDDVACAVAFADINNSQRVN